MYRNERFQEKQRLLLEEKRLEKEAEERREIAILIEREIHLIKTCLDSEESQGLDEEQRVIFTNTFNELMVNEKNKTTTMMMMMTIGRLNERLASLRSLKQSIEEAIRQVMHDQHKRQISFVRRSCQAIADALGQYQSMYNEILQEENENEHDNDNEHDNKILNTEWILELKWMKQKREECEIFYQTISKLRSKEIIQIFDKLEQQCKSYSSTMNEVCI